MKRLNIKVKMFSIKHVSNSGNKQKNFSGNQISEKSKK